MISIPRGPQCVPCLTCVMNARTRQAIPNENKMMNIVKNIPSIILSKNICAVLGGP